MRFTIARSLTVAVLTAALVVAGAPAHAAPTPTPEAATSAAAAAAPVGAPLINAASKRCLDVPGSSTRNRTNTGDKDSIPNNSNEKILRLTLGG